MIFVSIGTSEPFDRLLAAVDALDTEEELVVQAGASRVRPARARCVDFLDFDETLSLMRQARVVVAHAGVGTLLTALRAGRLPLLVPRLPHHGEAVDDHQLVFATRVAELGLAVAVTELDRLPALVRDATGGAPAPAPAAALVDDLRGYIAGVVGVAVSEVA